MIQTFFVLHSLESITNHENTFFLLKSEFFTKVKSKFVFKMQIKSECFSVRTPNKEKRKLVSVDEICQHRIALGPEAECLTLKTGGKLR